MISGPRSRKVVGRSAYQTKTSLSIGRGIASRRRDLELSHSMRTKRKAIVIISGHHDGAWGFRSDSGPPETYHSPTRPNSHGLLM